MSGAVELEVRTSVEPVWHVTRGDELLALRVAYRPAGARKWQAFLLVPDPGQTIAELERHANVAAQLVHARRLSGNLEGSMLSLGTYGESELDGAA